MSSICDCLRMCFGRRSFFDLAPMSGERRDGKVSDLMRLGVLLKWPGVKLVLNSSGIPFLGLFFFGSRIQCMTLDKVAKGLDVALVELAQLLPVVDIACPKCPSGGVGARLELLLPTFRSRNDVIFRIDRLGWNNSCPVTAGMGKTCGSWFSIWGGVEEQNERSVFKRWVPDMWRAEKRCFNLKNINLNNMTGNRSLKNWTPLWRQGCK